MTMKLLNRFRKPSVDTIIRAELEEAELQLLAAQRGVEYARAIVEYESSRIKRLKDALHRRALEQQQAIA